MQESKFLFWQKWLTYSNFMAIIVGLICAFAGNSIFFEMHNDYSAQVFFDAEDFDPQVLRLKNWLFGIIGASIVGFHVLMIMISEYAFKHKERWSYRALWYGLVSWFLIDSSISLYYGAIHNVLMINIVALVLIALPLIVTKNEFLKSR